LISADSCGVKVTITGAQHDCDNRSYATAEPAIVSMCEQLGQPPNRPASGKLMLRIPPNVHARALRSAELAGTRLNRWAAKVLDEASMK
jgi:predicted HicB family RNase H-like nuclease